MTALAIRSPARTEYNALRVVVMAASAGGIAPLLQVLAGLPADLPAAFLVVQHLRADRPTRLAELIGRRSRLSACLARNGQILAAGSVYLAVPGQHLRFEQGQLALNRASPVHHVRPAADVLFSSVAVLGDRVIAVVLSGTGRDGARGCQEIKARGGAVIVQDEETSAYFGMPSRVIERGVADWVLPIGEIADKIELLVRKDVESENANFGEGLL